MCGPGMDNGEHMMRAYRAAMQAQQQYNQANHYTAPMYNAVGAGGAYQVPGTNEEQPAEDVTGLRMLDEFLQRRKQEKSDGE